MSGNSLSPMMPTPWPDHPSQSDDDHAVEPLPTASPSESASSSGPTGSSTDDLDLLLSQSKPDPYLREAEAPVAGTGEPPAQATRAPHFEADPGLASLDLGVEPGVRQPASAIDGGVPASGFPSLSSSESELGLPIAFTPESLPQLGVHAARVKPTEPASADSDEESAPRRSWPLLLVSSYASAMTLALLWVLFSGRTLPRSESPAPADSVDAAAGSSRQKLAGDPPAPLPAQNLTRMGEPIRLGEVEVLPRFLVRRALDLVHLAGASGDKRETPPSLVLTVRLKNVSATREFAPLTPTMLRDVSLSDDQSFIELPGGRRIAMFRLATESEWSIEDQILPTLKPGEEADTILASEAVSMPDLASPMIWRVKLRTGTFRTDVVGIRFTVQDVSDESP